MSTVRVDPPLAADETATVRGGQGHARHHGRADLLRESIDGTVGA
ncbi:MAG: hypothetical protein AVDCRST_MAG36-784 [uncultured Nocardioidaceae bacterium]|uniref:Uncharacterized protein n=1 Tax=uncultured Nocardioidaceae bacterium TaxID=253824 RepID=A0A6J4LA86_9ACTN|nr:MAG: hypothetical protein AVDCRST_MAG36-784 [uncultured Nocardioidaceae bacterium]